MRNSPGSEVRGGARRLRLIRLAAIVAVMSVGAGGLLFFAVSGWPDVPGQAIADAESVKQERSTEQDRAREDQGSASSMPAAGADTTEPALSFANSVVKQADAWNIRTCLSQVTRISDFLTSGHSYTALSQRILRDAGEGAFSATIVARDRSGLDSISTLVSVKTVMLPIRRLLLFRNSVSKCNQSTFQRLQRGSRSATVCRPGTTVKVVMFISCRSQIPAVSSSKLRCSIESLFKM